MSNPAAVGTRIFRFGLRFSLIKSSRTGCAIQTKALYHSFIVKKPSSYNLPCNLVKYFTRRNQVKAMSALSPKDPASYSRPELAIIKHVGLNLNVDFEKKVLSGAALLQFDALQDVDEVILDMSAQTIHSVEMENGTALKYRIDGHIANFGSKLTITLPQLVPTSGNHSQKQETVPVSSKNSSMTPRRSKTSSMPATIVEGDDFLYKLAPVSREMRNKKTFVLIPVDENECDTCECESDEETTKSDNEKNVRKASFSQGTDVYDADQVIGTSRKSTPQIQKQSENAKNDILTIVKLPDNFQTSTSTVALSKNAVKVTLGAGQKLEISMKNTKDVPIIITKNAENNYAEIVISKAKTSNNNEKAEEQRPKNTQIDLEKGSPINFQTDQNSDRRFTIKIKYTTDPAASALQWLEPSQTSGKAHPYLFSQCQPIHARSILPCQDTPAVKFTYDAEITAPEPFTILMSALSKDRQPNKAIFHQPVPLPSYLVAIAVGVLEKRSIGPRTNVWTEKEEIERSAWEFADTEKYLQAAERLCGPYVWTQYDLLVLPPSFPYGGMENPCLTFVTPTLLAGDRSQADVIVHEIMHSWTGNLVTNRNFEHFWLNEGFTVFLERKVASSLISDPVEAKKSRDFHSLLGLQELSEAVKDELGVDNPLTQMVVNLTGVHPDDAFSTVPYEKGSLFLRYLEDLIGIEVFDDFLRAYLTTFQRKSLDTDEFKAYLFSYFSGKPAAEKLAQVDWTAWLYTPGMPPIIPNYDTSMTKAVTNLLAKIDRNDELSADDVKDFTPHQLINFLQEMIDRKPLPADRLEALGALYKVADSHNSEIRYRWLRLCVRSKIAKRVPEVLEFVNSQGRMKYVRPLYRDLYAWEEVRDQAITNFRENERYMMHVSAYTIRKDLHLSENMIQQQ